MAGLIPATLVTARNIQGTSIGNTAIYAEAANAPGQVIIPVQLLIVTRSLDTVTAAPTISVGTNSPNFNNLMAATLLSDLTASLRTKVVDVAANAPIAQCNGNLVTINVRVSVAANAVDWRFDVGLIAYQLNTTE